MRLDLAIKHTSAVLCTLSNKHSPLLNSEALGSENVVGHAEKEQDSPADGQSTAENVDNTPDIPALGLADSVEENTAKHATEAVEAVEQTGTGGLYLSTEPLRDDEHKGWSDDGFEGTE